MKVTIAQDLLFKFEQKMESFARKFTKYGQGTYSYIKSEPYICEDKDSIKFGYWVVDIDIDASYKLGDYKFVAALEWVEEVKENLIKKLSDDIYVPEIYKARRECDHCKTHRYRKSTVLLVNEKGDYIQVGNSCVKEYCGIDIGNYAKYLSFFKDLDEYLIECEKDNLPNYKRKYEVDEILTYAIEDVKRHGYISKQNSIDYDCDSTAYKVFMMVTCGVDYNTREPIYPKYDTITVENIQDRIKEIKNFYSELESDSDYINNIKTILQTKWVNSNNIALVVSAIGTKLRIEKEKEEKANKPESQFIGNVGDKISFIAKPECIYSGESDYGMFRIYKMKIDDNEIIWKTSKYLDPDFNYEFKATIKNHEEYKGVKQTEITRARTTQK